MSLSDHSNNLEQLISSAMDDALEGARRSLAKEIRQRSDRLARDARADGLADLGHAVVEVDAGGDQAAVLSALVEQAGRFASRSALVLTFTDGFRGWASYGFDDSADAIDEAELDFPADGPWSSLADGSGWIALDGEACAELTSQLGADGALRGLLVPLVLRGRLAAALYVDQLAEDEAFSAEAVQVLAYAAAHRLELLALGQAHSTATLHEAAGDRPDMPLWDPTVAATAAAAPAPAVVAPAAEAVEEPAEPEAVEAVEEEPAEAEIAAEPDDADSAVEAAEPEEVEAVGDSETPWAVEDAGVAEVEPDEVEPVEVVDEVEPDEVEPVEVADDDQETTEISSVEPDYTGATVRISPDVMKAYATDAESIEAVEEVTEAEVEPVEAEPVEVEADPVEVEADPVEAVEVEAVEVEAAPEAEAEPEPEPEPPPKPSPPAAGGSTQVAPPPDLEGPGWAFRNEEPEAEEAEEVENAPLHEEARRLARLLVSEIKLYNEEQVEEGRRNHDIYARLREDIDRSRQMYAERVDPSVGEQTDYFYQEMVNILAGGNADALGM